MRFVDYPSIIRSAWNDFDSTRPIELIEDISARVSTNHVFRVTLEGGGNVIAKLSYFGKFEHFKEDHRLIHTLANNLLYPFENVLAKSLVKSNQVFVYRFQEEGLDVWVVFYNPIRVAEKMPRRLEEHHIRTLGSQIAKFHKACASVSTVMPKSSKTLRSDVQDLLSMLNTETGRYEHRMHIETLRRQCNLFLKHRKEMVANAVETMPVFLDWNIGNFSVTDKLELFSRWDYDWFRISYRVMDFYFFSRGSAVPPGSSSGVSHFARTPCPID